MRKPAVSNSAGSSKGGGKEVCAPVSHSVGVEEALITPIALAVGTTILAGEAVTVCLTVVFIFQERCFARSVAFALTTMQRIKKKAGAMT